MKLTIILEEDYEGSQSVTVRRHEPATREQGIESSLSKIDVLRLEAGLPFLEIGGAIA